MGGKKDQKGEDTESIDYDGILKGCQHPRKPAE